MLCESFAFSNGTRKNRTFFLFFVDCKLYIILLGGFYVIIFIYRLIIKCRLICLLAGDERGQHAVIRA